MKFIKHPLFWKEWKTAKWIALLMTILMIVFNVISLNQHIQGVFDDFNKYHNYYIYRPIFINNFTYHGQSPITLFTFAGVVSLSILLFKSTRSVQVGRYMASLPFTRNEQLWVKWLVGIISISIPFMIATVLDYLIYIKSYDQIQEIYKIIPFGKELAQVDQFSFVLQYMGMNLLVATTVFSFLVFMQTIMGHSIIATIVGMITLFIPSFWLWGFESLFSNNFKFIPRQFNIDSTLITSYGQPGYHAEYLSDTTHCRYPLYTNIWLHVIVLLLIIVISCFAARYAFNHNRMENNGSLFMFPIVKKLFVIGVSVSMAFLFALIAESFWWEHHSMISYDIGLLLGGIIGYIITKRIVILLENH